MEAEEFVASRLTRGNFLFPTRIVITDRTVMRKKRSWFSSSEESVHLRNVATVNIQTGILWSDIRIESSGGSDPIESHGHTKSDARRIKELIEERQRASSSARSEPAGDDADLVRCPHCAEKIQRGAKVCRYCGRDIR